MKKLLPLIIWGLLWFIPVNADNHCPDKNPEIILDLGGTIEPEKIVYATYNNCTKQSDYCGVMGCSLDVFDHTGENTLSYIAKDDWFIRPVNIVGQKPTYELIMPLSNGKFRIVKVIHGKLTEIESDK
jgi:putative lipase involved disintegration of autophagic bodies|tara:strand:- start:42 stop:425 length:384 start_codon:yes stop_codon:yes gene_type:complete